MARIKPNYSSRNFSPDTSRETRACALRINGTSELNIDFDFFDEYVADMPTFLFLSSITGYDPIEEGTPIPLYEYSTTDLSGITNISGLSTSILDEFVWPRYQKPYGISALDFLELFDDPDWSITGTQSGNPLTALSSEIDYDNGLPQLNTIEMLGVHLPSLSFKNRIENFFNNIPFQTGIDNTGLFISGTDQEFEDYLSGIGVTGYSGSNYISGSGNFSGYLTEDAYNSGLGFYVFNNQIVGEHIIFDNNVQVYSATDANLNAEVGWFQMSNEEADSLSVSLNEFSNLSGAFYLSYTGAQ